MTTRRLSGDQSDLDLRTLERQLRLGDTDRKDDVANTLRVQATAIEKLTQDNKQLKEELEIVQRDISHSQTSDSSVRILQAKIDFYESEIESERENLAALDAEVAAAEAQVKEERKRINTLAQDPSQSVTTGHIKTLENRLETALREYNTCLTQNAQSRQTIDHLKQERSSFDSLARRLGRDITELKKHTAEVIEKSTQAHEVRDEALAKIAAMKDKSDKELAQYSAEIKELTRVLEHERKLRGFMVAKGQDRKDFSATQTLSHTKKAAAAAEKDSTPEERLATLERQFTEIKAIAGVQEIDKAVEKFFQGEKENFSAFNLVNELNSSIELLQEKISDLKVKTDKTIAESETSAKTAEHTLAQLQSQISSTEQQIAAHEALRDQATQEVAQLSTPIEELFTAIGCERTVLDETLGNAHVNPSNIRLFLTTIEERVNALLQVQARLDAFARRKWEKAEQEMRDTMLPTDDFNPVATLGPKPALTSLLGPGPQPAAAAAAATGSQVHLPTTEAMSDHEDVEEDRPLSLNEFKSRIKSGDLGQNQSKQAATKKGAHTSILRTTQKKR